MSSRDTIYLEGEFATENETLVSPESLMVLFTLQCCQDFDINIVFTTQTHFTSENTVPYLLGIYNDDLVYSFKYLKKEQCPQMIQNCLLPAVFVESKPWVVVGLSSSLRHLLTSKTCTDSQHLSSRLLGFRMGCLQACAEVSVWTKFCEIEAVEMLKEIFFKLELNTSLTVTVPNNMIRYERHLERPPILHNGLKRKQENLVKVIKDKAKCLELKKKKLKELPELEHKYAEGVDLTLADLLLYVSFSLCMRQLGQILNFQTICPLVKKWLSNLEKIDYIAKERKLFRKVLEEHHPISATGDLKILYPDIQDESLYKSDPNRYKPRWRSFTHQKDIDEVISKLEKVFVLEEEALLGKDLLKKLSLRKNVICGSDLKMLVQNLSLENEIKLIDIAMVTEDKNEKKNSSKENSKKGDVKEEELSEEDKLLQDELNLLVERLQEPDTSLYMPSLEQIRSLIRSSTTSMTSVPKPLKFMRQHYDTMKEIHKKITDPTIQSFCSDIVSVLAMTMSEERECLKYRLLGQKGDVGDWGHEYVRHLSSEIASEWETLSEEEDDVSRKNELVREAHLILPYHMQHNAEAEACDLLMEMEHLELLTDTDYVDHDSYERVCLYLTSCVPYVPDPENTNLLHASLKLYTKFKQYPQAMRLALQLNDQNLIKELFEECPDKLVRMQVAFMLARQQFYLELSEEVDDYEDLNEILSNANLNTHFLSLARELDIMEPKTPEDIYKSHLENNRPPFGSNQVDSARQNLASSFVNGFVNAAFGADKLLTDDGNKWLYKNKEHGMLSATASHGLILLWDVDGGLSQIDKYFYSSEDFIKAGALLACGIVSSGVRNECDPALALLSDYVMKKTMVLRIGAVLGLGLAYAGSNREEVIKVLTPVLTDEKSSPEVIGVTALSLGLIAVGTTNQVVVEALVTTLLAKSELELKETYSRFISLGLALTYLGCQDKSEVVLTCIEGLPAPFRQMTATLIDVCAYAGTGNVLKVQEMLHICTDHYEQDESKSKEKDSKKEKESKKDADKDKEKEKAEDKEVDLSSQQSVAVLGIAIISMGEDIGAEMSYRQFGNLLRYCEPVIRRAVPLALALSSVSNPKLNILDTLSKFSHDSDSEVAHNSIFAMGLVGAGTNNARLAAMLRQLAQYHAKDPNNLFMVRLAQGLTHLGKGTMTLSPYHSNKQLMSPVAVAGLLATCIAFLDAKTLILGKSHYLLYCLVSAMQPRMLVTFDDKLNPLPVSVRVGQAVDVVGQAGKPKTITGFQTHTTPVLLAHGERAELATDEYTPLTPIMEGFVILNKNPDFEK